MKRLLLRVALCGLASFALLLAASCTAEKESSDDAEDDATATTVPESTEQIKAAMQTYIDAKLASNNNVYAIGELEGTYDNLHEGIREMDGNHVSCADVNVGEDVYDVDLFVAETEAGFAVVKEVLHQKNGQEVNELLWEMEAAPVETE